MTKIDWTLIETVLKPAFDRRPEQTEIPGRPRMSTLGTEFDMARENRNNFG
jgi:hypothetical protein